MLVWDAKDPDEVVIYSVDWADRLFADYISAAAFSVVSGDVTLSDTDHDSDRLASVTVSGGTANTKAKILCEIDTADGQTFQQTATLVIRAR